MSVRVAVLGAGAWGTALANLLARKGNPVMLWSWEESVADAIRTRRENTTYLPGVVLDDRITASTDLAAAVVGAPWIVSVSPAQHVREVISRASVAIRADAGVISASKGLELGSLETMAGVLSEALPAGPASRLAFLSGPSFAAEVAQELATAVTVASRDPATAGAVQRLFQTPRFRVYTTDDVVGVELGGALKNVIALAAGMAVGLGLGHNARAALITRGLAEIARLASSLGANPLTLSGLAGMGDLILTCTGELSRNRHVGVELGRGRPLHDILAEMKHVAEGIDTTRAAHALAARERIQMPIVAEVHSVLFEGRPARDALDNLMLREPKPEIWS